MFTGIIEATGKVQRAQKERTALSVSIEKPRSWKLTKGQSIAVDGICSTVVKSNAKEFSVEYMSETLAKTTAGQLKRGGAVNLERSVRLNQFIDGHLTLGHVDACARVVRIEKNLLTISVPKALEKYIVLHGSITLNGVALTVARMKKADVTVALIPYTLAHTNLGTLSKGDLINIEIDLIARYILKSH